MCESRPGTVYEAHLRLGYNRAGLNPCGSQYSKQVQLSDDSGRTAAISAATVSFILIDTFRIASAVAHG
jgi:hypothetical protein